MLITEDGLSARIALPLSADMLGSKTERKPTARLLSIVLATDPLKRGSLKRMQELVAGADKSSLVPVLSTPALYNDDNSGEQIDRVTNSDNLDKEPNSIKPEVVPRVCQHIPIKKDLEKVSSPVPRPYIEPSIYEKLFGVLTQLGVDMQKV
jgi:hypothetical protein